MPSDFPVDITKARQDFLRLQRKRKQDREARRRKRPAKPKPPAPTVYHARDWSPDEKARWINALCVHLTEGGSMRGFVRQYPQGPVLSCWYDWLAGDPIFAELYARARENGADTLAEETVAIADSVKDAGQYDSARVNAARLMVDARKWVASKLKPKTYADRIETVTSGSLTVRHTITDEDSAQSPALHAGERDRAQCWQSLRGPAAHRRNASKDRA